MIRNSKLSLSAVITILAAILLGFTAERADAQTQKTEFQVYARYSPMDEAIDLNWTFSLEYGEQDIFEVWYAEGTYSDVAEAEFELLTELGEDDWEYNENGRQNIGMYRALVKTDLGEGVYTLYMKTAVGEETFQSKTTLLRIGDNNGNKPRLRFTSEPETKGYVGKAYEYQATAEDPNDEDAEIVYSLTRAPDGMEINEETGLIAWTPEEKGQYNIHIQAQLKNDSKVKGFQNFQLQVFSCENPATISGVVSFENGKDLKQGHVTILPEDYERQEGEQKNVYHTYIEDGKFSLEVDKGSYYLLIQGQYGLQYWYENAEGPESATLIAIECGKPWNPKITLSDENDYNLYNVSGKVTMGESGEPIGRTHITFYKYGEEHISPFKSTFTNEDGEYNIQLPDKFSYIAMARIMNNGETQWKTLYYNQTTVRDEAEVLELSEDLENIDFTFTEEMKVQRYTVSGKVENDEGEPVSGAMVHFIPISDMENDMKPEMIHGVKTDEEGKYSTELPDVFKYYAYVMNQNMLQPLYYEQTYDKEEADEIELTGDRDDINFVIESPDYEEYTVSGNVSWENGDPIAGATVSFQGFSEDEQNRYGQREFRTKTDEDGNYELELPEIFNYIASAHYPQQDRYGMEIIFYDQARTPEEADIIELDSDLSGIDFVFDQPQERNSSISGVVENSDGEPIGNVLLRAYNLTSSKDYEKMYNNMKFANNEGEFRLSGLTPGEYIIFALPARMEYMPGFYKESDFATMDWNEATKVEVEENENVSIAIKLEAVEENFGLCELNGRVKKRERSSMNTENASSATVYLKNQNGKVCKYKQTAADGSFAIQNIAAGEYNLVVEKVGYEKHESAVNVTEKETRDYGEIVLEEKTMSVGEPIGIENNVKVYPNPSTDVLNIEFLGNEIETQIQLINAYGEVVATKTINPINGTNVTELDISDVASGAYYLIIQGAGHKEVEQVRILK